MYIGRIVSVAMAADGRLCAAYRVSSRSFPNRKAVVGAKAISIVPKEGHESDVLKNPYISYNCARVMCDGAVAVVTNGSQTDPVAEKIGMGMPIRDALALSMLAMDFEKDDYSTPRICAVADKRDGSGWLGIVRKDGMDVRRMPLEAGQYFYVATYEENVVTTGLTGAFTAGSAEEACRFMLGGGVFAERTNPVTAVAAMARGEGFELATLDAAQG